MTDWQSMETAPNEALNSASRISRETADILERRSFFLRYSSPMSSRLQSVTSITHLLSGRAGRNEQSRGARRPVRCPICAGQWAFPQVPADTP